MLLSTAFEAHQFSNNLVEDHDAQDELAYIVIRNSKLIEFALNIVLFGSTQLNLIVKLSTLYTFTVKRDIQDNDEEALRVKEQSILELGGLLAKTGQAAGKHL